MKAETLSYHEMTLDPKTGSIMNTETKMGLRAKYGYCVTCPGVPVRLIEIQRSRMNPLWCTRKPRTVPGECYDGKCIRCNPYLLNQSLGGTGLMGLVASNNDHPPRGNQSSSPIPSQQQQQHQLHPPSPQLRLLYPDMVVTAPVVAVHRPSPRRSPSATSVASSSSSTAAPSLVSSQGSSASTLRSYGSHRSFNGPGMTDGGSFHSVTGTTTTPAATTTTIAEGETQRQQQEPQEQTTTTTTSTAEIVQPQANRIFLENRSGDGSFATRRSDRRRSSSLSRSPIPVATREEGGRRERGVVAAAAHRSSPTNAAAPPRRQSSFAQAAAAPSSVLRPTSPAPPSFSTQEQQQQQQPQQQQPQQQQQQRERRHGSRNNGTSSTAPHARPPASPSPSSSPRNTVVVVDPAARSRMLLSPLDSPTATSAATTTTSSQQQHQQRRQPPSAAGVLRRAPPRRTSSVKKRGSGSGSSRTTPPPSRTSAGDCKVSDALQRHSNSSRGSRGGSRGSSRGAATSRRHRRAPSLTAPSAVAASGATGGGGGIREASRTRCRDDDGARNGDPGEEEEDAAVADGTERKPSAIQPLPRTTTTSSRDQSSSPADCTVPVASVETSIHRDGNISSTSTRGTGGIIACCVDSRSSLHSGGAGGSCSHGGGRVVRRSSTRPAAAATCRAAQTNETAAAAGSPALVELRSLVETMRDAAALDDGDAGDANDETANDDGVEFIAEVLIGSMDTHPDDLELQAYCLRVLSELCTSARSSARTIRCQSTRTDPDDSAAAGADVFYCRYAANDALLSKIVDAMQRYYNNNRRLANPKSEGGEGAVAGLRGPETALLRLRLAGCRALRSFARNEHNHAALVRSGACECLFRAVEMSSLCRSVEVERDGGGGGDGNDTAHELHERKLCRRIVASAITALRMLSVSSEARDALQNVSTTTMTQHPSVRQQGVDPQDHDDANWTVLDTIARAMIRYGKPVEEVNGAKNKKRSCNFKDDKEQPGQDEEQDDDDDEQEQEEEHDEVVGNVLRRDGCALLSNLAVDPDRQTVRAVGAVVLSAVVDAIRQGATAAVASSAAAAAACSAGAVASACFALKNFTYEETNLRLLRSIGCRRKEGEEAVHDGKGDAVHDSNSDYIFDLLQGLCTMNDDASIVLERLQLSRAEDETLEESTLESLQVLLEIRNNDVDVLTDIVDVMANYGWSRKIASSCIRSIRSLVETSQRHRDAFRRNGALRERFVQQLKRHNFLCHGATLEAADGSASAWLDRIARSDRRDDDEDGPRAILPRGEADAAADGGDAPHSTPRPPPFLLED